PRLQDPQTQIRLFVLSPGDPDSEVRGDFTVVDQDDETPYQCISCAWGDVLDTTHIVVGGERFTVTRSLFSALRRIRSTQNPITLWADALCINQEDSEEKRLQVNKMFRIYSNCSHCFIWLGEIDTDRAGFSLETARATFTYLEAVVAASPEDPWPRDLSTPASRLSIVSGLQALLECPCWSRIWTLQECVAPVAATVLRGPLSMPWTSLLGAANKILHRVAEEWDDYMREITRKSRFTCVTVPVSVLGEETKMGNSQCGIPALNLFWRYIQRHATDPRDRVYASIPSVSHALESVKSSDYEAGYEDLYSRVTTDLI
ncbi:heterokaryon incompatibility protein-domain-containing protein, partial [Colletotrichum cereale]